MGIGALASALFGVACGSATASTTSARPALSSPAPTPAQATVGAFHFSNGNIDISTAGTTQIVSTRVVLHPGASTGWHTHTGPGFAVVLAGIVTVYQLTADGSCKSMRYSAGEGYIETPGTVHIARDEATVDAIIAVTFLGVPVGEKYKVGAWPPVGCPGIA